MRLGIMQPYFFPYLGYFELIKRTDRWVVFDVVKYQSRSWMNRNVVEAPGGAETYIQAPVVKRSGQSIADTRLSDFAQGRDTVLNKLERYRRAAPHFQPVRALVEAAYEASDGTGLVSLNVAALASVCAYLEIPFDPVICSRAGYDFSAVDHPGKWALEICRQAGADGYLNPPGGMEIFRQHEWDAAGIDLLFTHRPDMPLTPRGGAARTAGLSIIDTLMWVPPDRVAEYLSARPLQPLTPA